MFFSIYVFYWNFFVFYYISFLFILFLLLASFTKRAMFPFSGWLPKAMRAPTPVSSLVHRSTLVTAGLVLLFNFLLLLLNIKNLFLLLVIGLFTIIISRVLSLYERDFKKIVALRTLSQMGFCFFSFGLRFIFLCYMHILSHSLFKRCLFIQVGVIIYYFYGQQDFRFFLLLNKILLFSQFQMLCCLFCLCGLFFSRGFFRKDLIMEFFICDNMFFIFFIIVVIFI